MATIEEEMKAQIAKEKFEKMQKIELEVRMQAYKNIESIKKWVKFFGILAVIGLVLIFLGLA
jgi:hypothetical protein